MPLTDTMRKVVIFRNVSSALKAEKILLSRSVPHKLIPVPKQISSDCGICLQYEIKYEASILDIIHNNIDYYEVRDYK